MANTKVTPTWVVNEVAFRFTNSVKGVAQFNRSYDDRFRQAGAKVGDTVQARLPQTFVINDGDAYNPSDVYDRTVPVSLQYRKHVDMGWTTQEEALELDRIKERYVNPAADQLANIADYYGMQAVYPAVYNFVGAPGTTPATNLLYLQAGTMISDLAGPVDGRVAVLDPLAMATLVNANLTLFNPSADISKNYRSGQFSGYALGVKEWYQDQNIPKHTTGAFTSCTPLVKGASQTGSTLATDGWASGASSLKKGDCFTIGGVYSVNPLTKQSTGRLQKFVVTADTSDSSGEMATLPISPAIITSGVLQTVSNSPADDAAINVWAGSGTYAQTATVSPQSLLFHPDFAAFVMADLADPVGGAKVGFARSKEFGISIRLAQQWDIKTDKNGSRLDILFGASPIAPHLACRIAG